MQPTFNLIIIVGIIIISFSASFIYLHMIWNKFNSRTEMMMMMMMMPQFGGEPTRGDGDLMQGDERNLPLHPPAFPPTRKAQRMPCFPITRDASCSLAETFLTFPFAPPDAPFLSSVRAPNLDHSHLVGFKSYLFLI